MAVKQTATGWCMKALMMSDLHANVRLPLAQVVPGGGGSDRLDDVLGIMVQSQDYALERGIADVFILGDLFDQKHPDGATLVRTSRCLTGMARAGLRLWLLPGNHDAVDRDGRLYTLQLYEELKTPGIEVLGHGTHEVVPGLRLHAMPWLPEDRARHRIGEINGGLTGGDRDILLLHQGIDGAIADGGWVYSKGVAPSSLENFSLSITGHFHTPQVHGWGRYLGSPLDLRFGDEEVRQRGFWEVDLDAEDLAPQLVPTVYPRFRTHRVVLEDGWKVEERFDFGQEIAASPAAYHRMIVEGPAPVLEANRAVLQRWMEEVRALAREPGAGLRMLKVETRPTAEVRQRLDLSGMKGALDLSEVARRYALQNAPEGLDPEALARIGQQYLARAGLRERGLE